MTLAFGPVEAGRAGRPRAAGARPFAVVQLQPEDAAASAYNLVGFQTRMTWTDQGRVLRTIPGLANAEFLRFGSVHRNTFVDAPRTLDAQMQLRARPGVYLAGQITGVEGYVESCASGFVCAVQLAQALLGRAVSPPPETTALGGVITHCTRPADDYQPSNVTLGVAAAPRDRPDEEARSATKPSPRERLAWTSRAGSTRLPLPAPPHRRAPPRVPPKRFTWREPAMLRHRDRLALALLVELTAACSGRSPSRDDATPTTAKPAPPRSACAVAERRRKR